MMRRVPVVQLAACVALAVSSRVLVEAADFIRGDVNGDGTVTISDAYRLRMWWRDDYDPLQCLDAADANDNGRVDWEDGIYILRSQYLGGPAIPSPSAALGEDPTDDLDLSTDCQAYGGGVILEDPASELGVSAAVARGGDGSEAMLYLALTNSVPIGAIFAQVRFLDPVLDGVGGKSTPGAVGGGWSFLRMTGEDRFVFGTTIGSSEYVLPPGQHADAVVIRACLKAGTPPGEYAFVIESVELTSAETGQAIVPRDAGGTLIVESTVSGADLGQCKGASNPPPPQPEDVTGGFTVGNATVPPGGVFTVPFTVVADAPIEGYSFSIDFDEEVLEVLSAEYVWPEPAETAYLVHYVDFDNRNDAPGNAGVDEGYVVGASVLKPFGGQQPTMLPDVEHRVVEVRFQVRPGTSETTTMLRFLDGGRRTQGQEVYNILSTYGFSVTPYISNSFAFLNGRVSIVADVATFVRGDSSGDGLIDISDPVMTLNFLYQGGSRPSCFDAADANDDSRLDVSDPVATLGFLFLGTGMPGPYPEAGADPTPDSMGCRYMQ